LWFFFIQEDTFGESFKKERIKMADDYVKYTFGDTEFLVPSRYIELSARGTGAQGMVV
jgi:hypothetical protein